MNHDTELSRRLHTWATEDMHFYSLGAQQTIPTPEDFNEICRGPGAAIWKWVIENVHSSETVKTVKGNLLLKRKTASPRSRNVPDADGKEIDETKQALLVKRASLSGEVTSTLRDIGHLEHDINRITDGISETEHAYEQEKERIDNMRRKVALLQAYSQKGADTIAQYGEYVNCINTRVHNIRQRAQKTLEEEEYYSRPVAADAVTEEDEASPALETASAKHVRECCEDIGQFLQDTLGGAFTGDKAEFSRRKEPLWKQVELVHGKFSSDQILSSLVTNTLDTTATLKSLSSMVDIRRDAQNLRFKYEGGDIQELAKPPSLLTSVHQLLQERNTEHFQRFILYQKYANESRNLEQRVAMVKGHIDKRLQKLFSNKATDLKLARSVVDVEVELAGNRSCLHCLTHESQSLKEIVQHSHTHRNDLFKAYHKIQEFHELTNQKQNVIQVLAKQNMNSQSRLDSQIEEISDYIQRSFQARHAHLMDVTTKLHGHVNTEASQFVNLTLPYLMFSDIDNALKTAVLDLSIHQTLSSHIRPALQAVLHNLNFHSFQAPERILLQCTKLKEEIQEAIASLDRQNYQHFQRNTDERKNIVTVIADLCKKWEETDTQQVQAMLPLLQARVNKTADALNQCLQAQDSAKVWWEEPGQNCVPWVILDNNPLQYYLDKWTILSTHLHQQMLK